MATAKINLKIGRFEFGGEGEAEWVQTQLDKILSKAPEILNLPGAADISESDSKELKPAQDGKKTLPALLREKNATENQTRKFLATAAWLSARGKDRLKTGDVTNALRENNQSRLGNASQCLADNIKQGFCERDGDNFFVTQDGHKSL